MSCWFHKWERIQKEEKYKFLNQDMTRYNDTYFRICKKCHKPQRVNWNGLYYSWADLTKEETEAILPRLKFNDIIELT